MPNMMTAHEIERFSLYGKIRRGKIGRNSLCNCGSGKKYKKCCQIQVVVKEVSTTSEILKVPGYEQIFGK